MTKVLQDSWALFLGVLLLQAGNALQGVTLGVRADLEGISAETFGYVATGYFLGFLIGSQMTPIMVRRVGHIRVFAALGSLVSAAYILYGVFVDPISWFLMRVLVGFCYSGIYIVSESWLNSISNNDTRGKVLSTYLAVQFIGVVIGLQVLPFGDPMAFDLFIVMSVLVSVAFAPILLSVAPAPYYETARAMSFRELYESSPLGTVGTVFMGGVFACMFGMGGVYAAEIDLSLAEISLFLIMLYLGGALFQPVIGWISDRMDRRVLIIILCAIGCALALMAIPLSTLFIAEVGGVRVSAMLPIAFIYGSLVNPLYGTLLAHTNDYLENDQMASAAGRFVFVHGVGAAVGPLVCGYLMGGIGPNGFWLMQAVLLLAITVYGLYRATQRPSVSVEETAPYVTTSQTFTPVAAEIIQEVSIERAEAAEQEAEEADDGDEPGQAAEELRKKRLERLEAGDD